MAATIAIAMIWISPATAARRHTDGANARHVEQHAGPPPFCIARGGGEGASSTYTSCQYYDYQSCIQAAVGGGNCVQNIETK